MTYAPFGHTSNTLRDRRPMARARLSATMFP
jgi:hypothetical protein